MAHCLTLFFKNGHVGFFIAEDEKILRAVTGKLISEKLAKGVRLEGERLNEFEGEWWLDAGGSILVDEPRVQCEVNGIKFGLRERHAVALSNIVFYAGEIEEFPDYVIITSWLYRNYIITEDTRHKLSNELLKLVNKGRDRMIATDARIKRIYDDAPGLERKQTCLVCGGDRPTDKCCGAVL